MHHWTTMDEMSGKVVAIMRFRGTTHRTTKKLREAWIEHH